MNKIILPIILLVLIIPIGSYVLITQKQNKKPIAQSHRNYEIDVVSGIGSIEPGKSVRIVYRIKNDQGKIIKDFETVHEKMMHFIVVRKDLQQFQHLHPTLDKGTGEFSVDVTFASDGSYRIFPDFTPAISEDNPQKLPVTVFANVSVGDLSKYKPVEIKPDTQKEKTRGEYSIFTLMTQKEEIRAAESLTYSLSIKKNNEFVYDLQPYLGALGHSVILKADTLDFIHTHAVAQPPEEMQDSSMQDAPGHTGHHGGDVGSGDQETGPIIYFASTFPEPGLYKLFTQFQHEDKVITIDYAVEVVK